MALTDPCVRLVTASPAETRQVAATVAGRLRLGDVVSLTGELGAGKTSFVQGAAAALGITDRVTSPSFLLRREYPGRVSVLHLDVYRLDTLQEVVDIGWEDALGNGYVTFVEWGDAMSPLLPADHLEVGFALDDVESLPPAEAERRRVLIRPHGEIWRRRLVELSADLAPWRR